MKKIIAVILALACCFAIFACKEEEKTAVDYDWIYKTKYIR